MLSLEGRTSLGLLVMEHSLEEAGLELMGQMMNRVERSWKHLRARVWTGA